MRAIITSRVSTEEQKDAGNSLPAQTARLKKYFQNKGYPIIKAFSFDESAYKSKRDDFDNILDFILSQKEKVAVGFDKVDRLSRNIFDKRVSILYEKALKDEIEIHFVSDGQVINSHLSAVEKFNFSISLGLAKYYSDAISDNVKRAQEQMLRMGTYPTRPPYGYKRVPISKDKTEIVIDDFPSKIVQKAYEWYSASSFSMELLRQKIKSEYGVDWSKGMTDKILKNHFYYGIMTWKNKQYKHKYPPIISKELFDQVQQVKASFSKKPFKYAGKPYIYRGLLRCGYCGLAITPEKHKGHVYYHCTQHNGKHGAKWVTEENLTEQIGSIFKRLRIPKWVLEKVVESLKTVHEGKMDFQNKQFEKLTTEHKTTTTMMDNLYLDKLKGRITDDAYDRYYQTFRDNITEIDTRLSMLQEAEDNYYITVKYLLELSNRAYDLFLSSEIEEKRQLVKLVFQNLRLDNKTVQYEAIKPFDTILNYADRQAWLENRNTNITTQLACIIKAFSDFRLVAQIREEIEKVKPCMAISA
ncbi:MAG: recombinase family protein [Candidatus Roizmanbacteria bacterium]|nr:recombinase family protein [Candidatus Roizmanbacteria bacterium]